MITLGEKEGLERDLLGQGCFHAPSVQKRDGGGRGAGSGTEGLHLELPACLPAQVHTTLNASTLCVLPSSELPVLPP